MTDLYPLDPFRALPAVAHRDPGAYDIELERVWRDGWVFVGTADQVANPGDYLAVDIGSQPVIVLRTQAGDLSALSNLCAHRGTLLVDDTGNAKRFQCPYHGWTYRDDGALVSTPYAATDAVPRDEICLPVYRAEQWHGLVFATLNPAATSVAKRLEHLDQIVADLGMADLDHWTSHRNEEVWQANWKLAVTNAMESYHVFKVHADTLQPYTPTSSAYYIVGAADGTATGVSTAAGKDYIILSLPPSFVAIVTNKSLQWQAMTPLAVDRTQIVTGGAYSGPPPEQTTGVKKWATKAVMAVSGMPDFLPEDKWICERGQRASSGDFTPGPLVPMEQVIIDFHHYLNRQLHDVPAPSAHTSATVGLPKPAVAASR